MPLIDHMRERVETVRLLVKDVAVEVAAQNNTIRSIALAGSWALGVPSPVDIDLVVIFNTESDVDHYELPKSEFISGSRLDFHCYSSSRIKGRMFKRKTRLPIVKCARMVTRQLRHFPVVKKLMIKSLGKGVIFFKSYELTPQADQILIPLVDQNNYLGSLQEKQRVRLEQQLSRCELTLHQPDGFCLLLQSYLDDDFSQQEIRPVLLDFYGDSKVFLQRVIQYSDLESDQRLLSLYEYIYGKLPDDVLAVQASGSN